MTNVAVKTHQMTERKLSSLVTGGPPLWITRHRHNSRFSSPSRSQQSSRNQQNVILSIQCLNETPYCYNINHFDDMKSNVTLSFND